MPEKAAPAPAAETAPTETPSASSADLLAAAQAKAPHLDAEFVAKHGLDDDYLARVAGGQEPPPPYNGPDTSTTDLHRTDGGWQLTPAGVAPEDVGKDQVGR